jgi:hypothetical protein
MGLASLIVLAGKVYGGFGALVALAFLGFGIDRIDPAARGAHVFRPLLIPGIVLLWPLVLWRWRQLERNRVSGA